MTTESKSLSRQVAELMGWRIEFAHTVSDDDGKVIRYFRVYNHKGKVEYSDWGDDEWPEYKLEEAYPDHEHDANLALQLTVEGYKLSLLQNDDGTWTAIYEKSVPRISKSYVSFERTAAIPAAAICEARLALAVYVKAQTQEGN